MGSARDESGLETRRSLDSTPPSAFVVRESREQTRRKFALTPESQTSPQNTPHSMTRRVEKRMREATAVSLIAATRDRVNRMETNPSKSFL